MYANLKISFKPYPVVRDRDIITKIDENISKRVVTLDNTTIFNSSIDKVKKLKIEKSLENIKFLE
jgi:hypothetical protein